MTSRRWERCCVIRLRRLLPGTFGRRAVTHASLVAVPLEDVFIAGEASPDELLIHKNIVTAYAKHSHIIVKREAAGLERFFLSLQEVGRPGLLIIIGARKRVVYNYAAISSE